MDRQDRETQSKMIRLRMLRIREWLGKRHVGQAFRPVAVRPDARPFADHDLADVAVYTRKLPHWELAGSTYFITSRIHGALGGILQDADLASIVEEALWFGYGERYALHAYVIMPDHVHVLMKPLAGWNLSQIVQGIKGFTARLINESLGRRGAAWQPENFDHLVRNEHDWQTKFDYIHENPVRAGLVERPEDYSFSSLVTMYSRGRLESLPYV